jgi:hypothetical protein
MPKKSPFRAVALAALTIGVAAACSEDEAPPPPLPEGPPDLRIVSIDAPGLHAPVSDAGLAGCFAVGESSHACVSPVSAPGCGFVVTLKTDSNKQIPLQLPDGSFPRFWTFQPPEGCFGAPDCGFALLLIDPDPASEPCSASPNAKVRQIAAGPVISVDYEALRKGINREFGRKKVRVELWPGEGVPDKANCHFAQIEVDFELTCGSRDGGRIDGAVDGGQADSGVDGAADGSADGQTPDTGPGEAGPDTGDASSDSGRVTDATLDGDAPDSSVRDASDASSTTNDGSVESG